MQYIEENPLRAKMVARLSDYTWSSYKLNIRKNPSKFIDREDNPAYLGLGSSSQVRAEMYKKIFEAKLTENKVEEVRRSVHYGEGYVSERFREQMKELLPRKRKRGRPRIKDKELILN